MSLVVRYPWLMITVALLCASCANGLVTPTDTESSMTVRTSIGGVVVDEKGAPIAGATVTAHGATTRTNLKGVYIFKNLIVPRDRVCVIARKDPFLTSVRTEWPSTNGTTSISLVLQTKRGGSGVNGPNGARVSHRGVTIYFPEGAFATSSGDPYDGSVYVGLAYLTPDSVSTLSTFMAGGSSAQRSDGTIAELTSCGVIRMGLMSGLDGQVQIAPGANAQITFPVPKSLAAATPSSIPLWYFDETIGMWKEEGNATLKAGVYKGTISRIADWNLGIPTAARAVVEGDVSCVANRAVGDVGVNIGQTRAMADENGHYRCRVPANTTLPVEVIAENNGGIGAAPITIAPIGANATRLVNITTESCPAMLEGVIVDCSNKPVAGFLQITSAQGTRLVSTSDGEFRTPIPHGEALSVIAYSLDAHLSSELTVADVAPGAITHVGTIEVCADPRGQFTDINVGSEVVDAMTFIEGGKTLAIVSRGRVLLYDVASGTLKRSIDVSLSGKLSGGDDMLMFNQDERVMLICGASSETRVYDVATGNLLRRLGPFVEYGLLTDDGMSVIAANYSTLSRVDIATGATVQTYSIDLRLTWQVTGYQLLGMQQGGSSFVFKVRTTSSDRLFVWDVIADSSIHDFVTYNSYMVADFLAPNGMMYGWLTNDAQYTSASISFMELRSGSVVSTIPAVYDTSASVTTSYAISPNEQLFVASTSAPLGNAGLPSVRRVANGVVEHVLALPSFTANAVGYAFDRANTMLAVSYSNEKSSSNIIRIYKL